MALQDFLASEGDAEFLESALRDSMDTLAHAGIVMEVKFAAGIVAIAAGYVHRSTVSTLADTTTITTTTAATTTKSSSVLYYCGDGVRFIMRI